MCVLTRPTDGKTAYVVDGGGPVVGGQLCQQLMGIGWVRQG
jgi:hypothetical protein